MNPIPSELDSSNRKFGSGWISGVTGLSLAIASLATVICFCYPQYFTVETAREFYVNNHLALRAVLSVGMIAAFILGIISVVLRQRKTLGFLTLTIVMVASLMGGAQASAKLETESRLYFGLDFFLLNLIFLGAVFIPFERIFKKNDQPILRYEWREDLLYFFISTLFVQTLTYLSLSPSLAILASTEWASGIRNSIASQPLILQFLEIMFLTDMAQYWFHRTFHQFPFLWKFHAVHHSAQAMDWIAGSRMHVVEIILLRAFTTLPMYVMGFAESALYAYIFVVYLMSVFIHSNMRLPLGFLQYLIATPRFHHWHHGIEEEAIDKNFAIHFPVIDMMFGTWHMPGDRWPDGYGVGGHPVPKGFIRQFLYPFTSKDKSGSPADDESGS